MRFLPFFGSKWAKTSFDVVKTRSKVVKITSDVVFRISDVVKIKFELCFKMLCGVVKILYLTFLMKDLYIFNTVKKC